MNLVFFYWQNADAAQIYSYWLICLAPVNHFCNVSNTQHEFQTVGEQIHCWHSDSETHVEASLCRPERWDVSVGQTTTCLMSLWHCRNAAGWDPCASSKKALLAPVPGSGVIGSKSSPAETATVHFIEGEKGCMGCTGWIQTHHKVKEDGRLRILGNGQELKECRHGGTCTLLQMAVS